VKAAFSTRNCSGTGPHPRFFNLLDPVAAMAVDHIRYDLLAQEALRDGVVRRVLTDAARNGLPGDHHFFITFDTRNPGVQMSARLQAQHPAELTIVLQHQFWDLTVTDDGFEVGLSFGGIPERLVVPFAAIKGFFDPSVEFGMRFEMEPGSPQAAAETTAGTPRAGKPAPVAAPTPELAVPTPPAAPAPLPSSKADSDEDGSPPDNTPGAPSKGGEVVRIDRFRKK
jgi:uncharacterized protein